MTLRFGLLVTAALTLGQAGLAQAGPRIRIFIPEPSVAGAFPPGSAASTYQLLVSEITQMFPCARVMTASDAKLLLEHQRVNAMFADVDANELLADLTGADIIASVHFESMGTAHASPGRQLGVTLYDTRRAQAMDRYNATGDGWNWGSRDLLTETLDHLRGTVDEVCPWLGSVTYRRTVQRNQAEPPAVTRAVLMSGAVTVNTETHLVTENSSQEWTFTLTRKRLGPVTIQTEGRASTHTADIRTVDSSNVDCFVRRADGEVRDDRRVTGVSQRVSRREEFKGEATVAMPRPQFRMVREDTTVVNGVTLKSPSWTLIMDSGFTGPGEGTVAEEGKGGCGSWRTTEPPMPESLRALLPAATFAEGIQFAVDRLIENNSELNTRTPLQRTKEIHEEVMTRLSRK